MPRIATSIAGWAAAALFFVLWAQGRTAPTDDDTRAASVDPTPLTHLVEAEKAGRIVGTLPPILVGTGQLDDAGEPELLYVRRVLERTHVNELPRGIAIDELGRPASVPASIIGTGRIESM